MANARMKQSWADMKSSIRSQWGEDLDDATLRKGRKDLNKMIDILHQHTGAPRRSIRTKIMTMV